MCDWIASKAQQAFSISKITGVVREGKKRAAVSSSSCLETRWKFLHRFGESVLATFGFSEYLRIASSVTVFGWDLCSTSRPQKFEDGKTTTCSVFLDQSHHPRPGFPLLQPSIASFEANESSQLFGCFFLVWILYFTLQ